MREVLVDGNAIGTITQGEGAGFYSIDEKGVHPETILLWAISTPWYSPPPRTGAYPSTICRRGSIACVKSMREGT